MKIIIILIIFVFLLTGCNRTAPAGSEWEPGSPIVESGINWQPSMSAPTPSFNLPATRLPEKPILSPTPDSPHAIPTSRVEPVEYIVQYGDYLSKIALLFSVSVEAIMLENALIDPNDLEIGQVLIIPAEEAASLGSNFKIIPDSELVFGPMSVTLNVSNFISKQNGYLISYFQDIEGTNLSADQILTLVAQNYSVNPRLLLALLEYKGGWLTKSQIDQSTIDFPLGFVESYHSGLYKQLTWSANVLNRGYYLWKVNGISNLVFTDGISIRFDNTINAGTAALQYFFSLQDPYSAWQFDVSDKGFIATYKKLFGNPFDYAIEPLVPDNLVQPLMNLPFEQEQIWAFTGGPHGGWDSGSAWAALDFAPPGEAQGCVISEAWVVSVADGLITRSNNGAVIQDLDGDGFEQTGWVVLYMHIDSNERIQVGKWINAGEKIGHPSCEGGVSNGTHVHLARKFNGEWISADGNVPFKMDGWISSGAGREYDGYLIKNQIKVEAFDGNNPINQIER